MVGRRHLAMGFGSRLFAGGATGDVEATPEVPVYVDRFLMPARLWRAFPSIELAKLGGKSFSRLEFSAIPDNPLAVFATPLSLVRVRAGESIVLTMINHEAQHEALRISALLFPDDEGQRP